MSLSTLIDNPPVRAWLDSQIVDQCVEYLKAAYTDPDSVPLYPGFAKVIEPQLIVNPTYEENLIGTAFDYLIRFWLKQQHPQAIEQKWIAEESVRLIPKKKRVGRREALEARRHVLCFVGSKEYARQLTADFCSRYRFPLWRIFFEEAVENVKEFRRSGKLSDDVFVSAFRLAQLDHHFRSGGAGDYTHACLPPDEKQIAELRSLLNIVPKEAFEVQSLLLLNPRFGKGSLIAGGADADVILDGRLIDIKTTRSCKVSKRALRQLVGYYCLHRVWGASRLKKTHVITTLELYFSRFGAFRSIFLPELFSEKQLDLLSKRFAKLVKDPPPDPRIREIEIHIREVWNE
jgi:hypothetical protein